MHWRESKELTEECDHVFMLFDKIDQYLVRDFLNGGSVLLLDQPFENLVLVQQIALVDGWDLVLEVNQSRKVIDTVFLRLGIVVHTDDHDPFLLQLVVNVLQLVQDAYVLLVVLVVYGRESIRVSFSLAIDQQHLPNR